MTLAIGEGLARTRDPQQRLVAQIALEAVNELGDRLGLVAGRFER